jgi:hypothetical protein
MTARVPHAPEAPLVFVGNAVRAAGYRLGGFVTLTPERDHEARAIEQAMKAASVIVIDAEVADRLPPARLEAWLASGAPPIVIATHADGTCSRADPAERVRLQLGLES